MKTTRFYFIALVLYFIADTAIAQTAEHKMHDYIAVVADSRKSNINIVISINGEKYQDLKLENTQGWNDYNEIIKIVQKYEKEGYEVFSSNVWMSGVIPSIYFLLRREHRE